jgi:hypothetical protein
MYIEHTPQGYNMMGLSPELLEEIILALRDTYPLEECPKIKELVDKAEYEINNNS